MRTSPVHYIAPSAISITPNANGSQRDIAVYIARGTKIKVHCPRAGIGTDADSDYQEWTITGRNRRLNDTEGAQEYTVYARLPRNDKGGGYLVFAAKYRKGNGFSDKYPYLTEAATDGVSVISYVPDARTISEMENNWFVRLGDVSAVENGLRAVTLDTGILGTDGYNNNWAQSPDDLPLRIELGCTINDEDVGLNPYVYWGQQLVLTATLTEGWTGTEIQRFDHWEIARNSGDSEADNSWLIRDARETTFSTSGEISLSHERGSDDFNGAVATTFTIMAMERDPEDASRWLVLKSATITILAETIEKYELALSSAIVSYSPQTGGYSPASGVAVRIRATDQRGDVFELTNKQFADAGLRAFYAPVGSTFPATPNLTFSGADNALAVATIPTTGASNAFATQQGLNVRLERADGTELDTSNIALVRDGEDSREREWIYTRRTAATTFSGSTGTNALPSLITQGEVSPEGTANGTTAYVNTLDEWVPNGWTDDPQGTSGETPYEYGSYRDYDKTAGHWGAFSTPKIWSHYGEDGIDGDTIRTLQVFKRSDTQPLPPTATSITDDTTNVGDEWTTYVPAVIGIVSTAAITGFSFARVSATNSRMTATAEGNSCTLNGESVNSGVIVYRASFTASERTVVRIAIAPSRESGYDFGAVGRIDGTTLSSGASASEVKNGTVDVLLKSSGTTVVEAEVTVDAGEHFFEIAYLKDISQSYGSDNALFTFQELVTPRQVWASTATLVNNNLKTPPGWSTPQKWNGLDGTPGTRTQRRYRSTNSPTYTDTAPTTEDAPSNWSEVGVPTQISATARYRWMIERTSDDGGASWGQWSAPVIDAYMAQDGTSIAIKGQAVGVVEWGGGLPASSSANNGDRWLHNNDVGDDTDVYQEDMTDPGAGNGTWEGESAAIGDCYLINGYLWTKVRNTPTASQPRWENMWRLQGLDGQNSIVVDLDNESEVMLYDGSGNRVSQAATSQARLYDGNEPVASGITWNISNATGVTLKDNGNATPSTYTGATDCWISSSGLVTVNGLTAADAEITVRAYYNSNFHYAKFTLHKQIGGDKYDIVASPNAVLYNSTTQQPYQTSVTVSLYKTTIDGNRALSAPPQGYTLCAFYDDGTMLSDFGQNSSAAFSVFPAATDANNIRIVVCQLSNDQIVAGTILDSETIPIARTENGDKGDPGDDAVTYTLEPSVSVIPRDHWKTPRIDVLTFVVHKSVGDVQSRLATQAQWRAEGLTLHYIKDGIEVSVDAEYDSETAPHTNYHNIELLYDDYDGIITWLVKKNGVEKARVGIGCASDGTPGGTGDTGHTGRFFYYDGPYSSSKTYSIEQTQAPYVKYTDPDDQTKTGFFMLDYGGKEPPNIPYQVTDVAPSFTPSANNPWTQMASEHQYYIARAFFGENAYLGSFIINDDWMISQYGTIYDSGGTAHEIDGTSSYGGYTKDNAYTLFNPQYPASSQPDANNFCPNFAVDGKTGNTIQGKGIFRGEVHATSGEFNGTVKANLFYSRTKWFDMPANDYQTYYIDPVSEPYSSFGVAPAQAFHGVVTIYLPIAADYDGIEFTFFSAPFEQYQTGAMDILPKSDDNLYVYSESSKKYVAASVIVPMKGIAKVKSFNGKWFLIEGDPSEAVLKTS